MESFLTQLFVFPFFLVLVRLASMLMTLPGFTDVAVSARIRMLMALSMTVATFAMVEDTLPPLPTKTSVLMLYIMTEVIMGALLGISIRIFVVCMNIAGEMVSFMTGLSAAQLFDPRTQTQTSGPSVFLSLLGVTLIFVADVHHLVIQAFIESYQVYPPGKVPYMGDTVQAIIKLMSDVFVIGIKISAPVVAIGYLIYVAFGVLNRLVPQMQVFFITMPLAVGVGLFVLTLSLSAMLNLYMDELFKHTVIFENEY